RAATKKGSFKVTVLLEQKLQYNEQTLLGFRLDDSDGYQYRLPIVPQAKVVELDDPPATITTLAANKVRVEVYLPTEPTQIAVDRTDFKDVAAGVEARWDHFPWSHTQIGFNAEKSLATFGDGSTDCDRASLYARYVFQYGSSLYLQPFHFLEAFTAYQRHFLP